MTTEERTKHAMMMGYDPNATSIKDRDESIDVWARMNGHWIPKQEVRGRPRDLSGVGKMGAYGNQEYRGDPGDGFGMVPMPGIIDAEVRTKSDDIRSYHINSDKIKEQLNFEPKLTVENAVQDLCTAFKKNVLQKNGGYNENFNAQDGWDLWHKIATKNNVSYIKNPVFNYRQHDKSISKNKLKILYPSQRTLF